MQPKFYGAAAQYNRPSSGGFGMILKIIGLVIGVIILITAGYFAITVITSGGKNSTAQLVARERQLVNFMTANQDGVDNDSLKTITSNAISLINSDHYSLTQGMKASYGIATPPEEIAKTEVDTTSKKTLDTAKIQSRYDKVYVELLRDKIASAQQLARTVLGNSGGTLHGAVQTSIKNLTTIDGQLAKLQL